MTAFEAHLSRHLKEFVGFARKRLRDPDLAADAVQESLLKALRAESQIKAGEKTKAWFYRILRRTIIDFHRRRDTRQRALEDLQRELQVPPGEEEERLVCRCIDKLLSTLTPQYADLIRRLDLEEEDPRSVADRLGVTMNNLNVRAHRARRQLRQRLEESCRVCAEHGCLDCHCENTQRAMNP